MPRRLHNWSYKNVTDFLNENGFQFYREAAGSHEAWIKFGNHKVPNRIVGIKFTSDAYGIKSMKRMVKESGIDQDIWIEWGSA